MLLLLDKKCVIKGSNFIQLVNFLEFFFCQSSKLPSARKLVCAFAPIAIVTWNFWKVYETEFHARQWMYIRQLPCSKRNVDHLLKLYGPRITNERAPRTRSACLLRRSVSMSGGDCSTTAAMLYLKSGLCPFQKALRYTHRIYTIRQSLLIGNRLFYNSNIPNIFVGCSFRINAECFPVKYSAIWFHFKGSCG